MISISLCMIVKNEENTLARCLDSVKDIVDEIVIVDTGSTDKTKEIASRYTDLVFDFEWIDDFSAARNFSFAKATKEYIFWLDADDVVEPEDREKFLKLKEGLNKEVDVVIMRYHIGNGTDGKPVCSFPRERLLKRSYNFIWYECVHEYLILQGNVINVDIGITHKSQHGVSTRNLDILKTHRAKGGQFSNRQLFYFARELFLNGFFPEAMIYYQKFLNTKNGLTSNYIDACLDLAHCYQLYADREQQLKTLMRSFEYTTPRAEVCCRIGYFYKDEALYEKAIEWYELATLLKKPDGNTTSVIHDFWTYVPYMELSICYYKLRKYSLAKHYNDLAGTYKPNDHTYLYNKEVFQNMGILSE